MLLEVRELVTHFDLEEGLLRAVDGITFGLEAGETLGLVGESGCGKTIVALSILNLVPWPGRIVSGKISFMGTDLVAGGDRAFRGVRGSSIGMIFQEPGAALNPLFSVGDQISEVLRHKCGLTKKEAEARAIDLLGEVGIKEPEVRAGSYPFELSGGMQQRVLIAIATCANPKLLIADEPTTALDVTIREEITGLLAHLQDLHGMSILLITHDLTVASALADKIMVMHTGKIVEHGITETLLGAPKHPYTKGLINSVPRIGFDHKTPLTGIEGAVPDFLDLPKGCAFHPRCPSVVEKCTLEAPPLRLVSEDRSCACFLAG